jgi:multidrug transporter EmrE-like cation transporter
VKAVLLPLLIAGGVGLTVLGDIFLKKTPVLYHWYTLAGFLLYGLIAVPVVFAFRITGFATLFLIWEAVTVLAGVIAGHLVFGEPLTAPKLLSLSLAISALILAYR